MAEPRRRRLYRPPPAGRIDHELIWGSLIAFGLALAWMIPVDRPGFSLFECPFLETTGLPCLFCGGTRAMHAFVHGQWGRAWAVNPLAAGLGGGSLLYLGYALLAMTTGWRWRPALLRRRGVLWLIVAGAALAGAANWIHLIAAAR